MKCVVFVLVVAAFTGSDCILPKNCTLWEYSAAYLACSRGIADLYQNMKVPKERYVSGESWSLAVDNYSKFCRKNLLQKWQTCITEANKMCEYPGMGHERSMKMVDLICDNIQKLGDLRRCFMPGHRPGMECLRNIRYDPADEKAICKLTDGFRSCIEPFITPCEDDVKKVVYDILEEMVMAECSHSDTHADKTRCSIPEYTITTAMCWVPYGMRLVEGLPKSGAEAKGPVQSMEQMLCSNDLVASLKCQSHLDQKCGISLINANEVEEQMAHVCKASTELLTIGQCVKGPALEAFRQCLMSIDVHSQSVCEMFNDARGCLERVFTDCSSVVRETVKSAFDIFVPKSCSSNKDGNECSNVEHLAGLAICWTHHSDNFTPAKSASPGYTVLQSATQRFKATCSSGVIQESLACQKKVDNLCKMSIINADKAKRLFDQLCDNADGILSLMLCLQFSVPNMVTRCHSGHDVTIINSKEQLCSLMSNMGTCALNEMKSSSCTTRIKDVMSSFIGTTVPAPCSVTGQFLRYFYLQVLAVSVFVRRIVI